MGKEFMTEEIISVAAQFQYDGTIVSCEPCHIGHINGTYFVTTDKGIKYVLQKVNTNVFTRPVEVMENMVGVCEFLKKKIAAEGGDVNRETLSVIPAKDGKMYYIEPDGDFWRTYVYVDDVISYNLAETPEQFRAAGDAFGQFFNRLADYPAETLHETIPNFHNTVSRFNDFKRAVAEDKVGRVKLAEKEIAFAMERESICSYIVDRLADGRFSTTVTHNDTKLNNVLFDKDTGKGLCIIDLDTVMPGSLLYDFGDAIRFGASSALEDETDLDKVYVVPEMFEAFTDGFLGQVRNAVNEEEIRALPISATLITFEIGLRFLTDFLQGDTYFRTTRENHNLDRARNQFKLVADGEKKREQLTAIAERYI